MPLKTTFVERFFNLSGALPGLVILALAGVAGCGFNQGFLRDSITRVQVDRGNFRTVAVDVSASVNSSSIFCVIPGAMKPLTRQLMKELHRKGNLRRNQMFINFRQDYSLRSMLIFICTYEHTLTADIIEFDQAVELSTSCAVQDQTARPETEPRAPSATAPVVEKNPANEGVVENPELSVTRPSVGVSENKNEDPAEEKPGNAKIKKPKKKANQVQDSDPIR